MGMPSFDGACTVRGHGTAGNEPVVAQIEAQLHEGDY
jgi:hypothetical protein